jgi:hypothetical protein
LTDELIEENKELKKEIQILKDEQVMKSAIGNIKPKDNFTNADYSVHYFNV